MSTLRATLAVLALALMPVGPIGALAPTAPAQAAVVAQQAPAEEFPVEDAAEEPPPWTARYLAPTVMAMAAVVLLLVVVGYGVRVRGRYRVVR